MNNSLRIHHNHSNMAYNGIYYIYGINIIYNRKLSYKFIPYTHVSIGYKYYRRSEISIELSIPQIISRLSGIGSFICGNLKSSISFTPNKEGSNPSISSS